jgi:hypothetical protein
MILPREKALELLVHWSSASRMMFVIFVDKSWALNVNTRLIEAASDKLRFVVRPVGFLSEPVVEFLLLLLDGSEEWDDAADPPGLDCSFKSGAALSLRVAPELSDFDLEPTSTRQQ